MIRKKSHFQDKEPVLEKILRYLRFLKVIKKIPEDSVILDLGCGFNGELLKRINNRIKEGWGIDFSVNRKNNIYNVKLIESDLNNKLPFENKNFDVVISLATVEHLYDSSKFLSECFRVLKMEGKLILTTPDPKSRIILEILSFFGLLSIEEIKDHKNYLSKKFLEETSKIVGFREIKIKKFQMGFNNLLIAKK